MPTKREPTDTERDQLKRLWDAVPGELVLHRDWDSTEGRAFMDALAKAVLSGAGVNHVDEAIGANGVVKNVWQRKGRIKASRRKPKP